MNRPNAIVVGSEISPPFLGLVRRAFELCSERNISINKLATICALPPSSLKGILYGRSQNPKILTIKMICDGLDITLAEFFDTPEFNNLEQEIK